MRLRRSELSTPASSERMIEKAAASSADLVFLDLEDSVSPNEKVGARAKVINALKTLDWGKKTRAVRVNDLETEYAYQDIISIVEEAGEYLDLLIVPKVKAARDVWWVDVLLSQIEKRLQRTRHRCHRWPIPRLQKSRRLSQGVCALESPGYGRKMGHPPRPDRHSKPGLFSIA